MNDIYLIDSNRTLDISVIDVVLLNVSEHTTGMLQIIARWDVYTKACLLNLYISPRAQGKTLRSPGNFLLLSMCIWQA